MAGNVKLIDPNNVNINNNITNGIPQYQDMYISVELTAIQRERTVLSTNMDVTQLKKSQGGKIVSFLGQNQDVTNSAHYNKFTTNWYDRATDIEKTYEGFGITNINIIVNSSYIPQIDVEFLDVRGLAFFNRENSPYRILFDFPPPIFFLTVKGYYGKAVTYQMHLVKYNTQLKAEASNYVIKAQFIAITYAPLTDIPFRYILQAPLMFNNGEETLSSDTNERPKNTFDLILKLENLYSTIPDKIKTDVDNLKYENAQKRLNSYNDIFDILYNYKENNDLKENGGTPIIFTRDNSPNSKTFGEIQNLQTYVDYNEYLKSFSTDSIPQNINKRLYIGYSVNTNGDRIILNSRNSNLRNNLNKFKNFLITKAGKIVNNVNLNDIGDAENIFSEIGAITDSAYYIENIGIDITDFYAKIYKKKLEIERDKRNAMDDLNTKINNMVHKKLGMLPTIYNIFEIILNDVDTFFDHLSKTAIEAEKHHNEFINQIINDGSYKDINNKNKPQIYAFPLIVKQEKICNQTKEVRTAPIDISKRLDRKFPELTLVQEFIDSFIKYNRVYQQATLKQETDAVGDYKWIPISPFDSVLVSSNIKSPYFGMDSLGGGTIQQPINISETDKLTQIFTVLLKRFYILSQNSLAFSFYNTDEYYVGDEDISKSYIKLYAQSEAINLVNSITNEKYAKVLEQFSIANNNTTKLNGVNGFYSYIEKYLKELYSQNGNEYFTISNGEDIYRDKVNESYRGLDIIDINQITERQGGNNDDFDEFIEENKTTWSDKLFKGKSENPEETFYFTQENVIFRRDTVPDGDILKKSSPLKTKFIASPATFYKTIDLEKITFLDPAEIYNSYGSWGTYNPYNNNTGVYTYSYPQTLNNLITKGNLFFYENKIEYGNKLTTKEKNNTSILDTWVNTLSIYDTEIYDDIIKYENGNVDNPELTALLYLSNFGYTLSPFNYFPYELNKDFFTTPSIVEAPIFVQLYMGALVGIEEGSNFYNEIYNFFVNGSGKSLKSGGALIFADIHDINTYLSEEDKDLLRQRYLNWFQSEFNDLASSVDSLYRKINGNNNTDGLFKENCPDYTVRLIPIFGQQNIITLKNNVRKCKAKIYEDLLTNDTEFSGILTSLTKRIGIAVFNEITFSFNTTITPTTYQSLQIQNNDNNKKRLNDLYFSTLFREISLKIRKRLKNLNQEAEDFRNSTGDEDIITQTYYSFKNLNDKWVAGLITESGHGYPFKTDKYKGLISQFAFVDRAMNPIGDTIINPQILIDSKDSPDLSVFSVLSQLLSINGFEFFPLQNFLKFTEDEWEKSFEINSGGIQKEYPVFVCMYIGGAASYPSGIGLYNKFEDDSIIDLNNPQVKDFLSEGCASDPDKDRQVDVLINNGDFLNEIRAFKVRYGEQNQNMFFGFSVDSNEYPETNESIQILSRLAGDNKLQAPVPKGQNLYNLYENRAYKATVTGLGNVMIQPTQYFQLENIPIYNGAYVILTVEHNIVQNKMTTKFSGTKLLKYPMPRVKNPASILGFEGGSTDETNVDETLSNEVTLGVGTAGNPDQAKYNSMYTLNIG